VPGATRLVGGGRDRRGWLQSQRERDTARRCRGGRRRALKGMCNLAICASGTGNDNNMSKRCRHKGIAKNAQANCHSPSPLACRETDQLIRLMTDACCSNNDTIHKSASPRMVVVRRRGQKTKAVITSFRYPAARQTGGHGGTAEPLDKVSLILGPPARHRRRGRGRCRLLAQRRRWRRWGWRL